MSDNLGKASQLMREKSSVLLAISNLDAGGKITGMTISSSGMMRPATVSTLGIAYPDAMVTTVRSALVAVADKLTQELAELGWTGG